MGPVSRVLPVPSCSRSAGRVGPGRARAHRCPARGAKKAARITASCTKRNRVVVGSAAAARDDVARQHGEQAGARRDRAAEPRTIVANGLSPDGRPDSTPGRPGGVAARRRGAVGAEGSSERRLRSPAARRRARRGRVAGGPRSRTSSGRPARPAGRRTARGSSGRPTSAAASGRRRPDQRRRRGRLAAGGVTPTSTTAGPSRTSGRWRGARPAAAGSRRDRRRAPRSGRRLGAAPGRRPGRWAGDGRRGGRGARHRRAGGVAGVRGRLAELDGAADGRLGGRRRRPASAAARLGGGRLLGGRGLLAAGGCASSAGAGDSAAGGSAVVGLGGRRRRSAPWAPRGRRSARRPMAGAIRAIRSASEDRPDSARRLRRDPRTADAPLTLHAPTQDDGSPAGTGPGRTYTELFAQTPLTRRRCLRILTDQSFPAARPGNGSADRGRPASRRRGRRAPPRRPAARAPAQSWRGLSPQCSAAAGRDPEPGQRPEEDGRVGLRRARHRARRDHGEAVRRRRGRRGRRGRPQSQLLTTPSRAPRAASASSAGRASGMSSKRRLSTSSSASRSAAGRRRRARPRSRAAHSRRRAASDAASRPRSWWRR